MVDTPARSLLRVVSPDELNEADRRAAEEARAAQEAPAQDLHQLAGFIRGEFEMMRNHRSTISGWNNRLLAAQRAFNGQYDAQKLAEIRQFGGSEVYARLIGVKCRGATALLRDVYLGGERSWALEATPDPTLPDDIAPSVASLVETEVNTMAAAGQQIPPEAIRDRVRSLMDAAKRAAKKVARAEAGKAQDKLEDMLAEGGFYGALAEFLVDLPLFPFACIKGPVVRIVPQVSWVRGALQVVQRPKMFWNRASPFDVYFTPGVSDIEDAAIIERVRLTRADLNQLLGLPGYDEAAIRSVLDEYGRGGLRDWLDPTDAERAENESRENPQMNRSGMIDCLEYHGNVQGRALLEYGFTADQVPDDLRDYAIQAWLIGRYLIKVQLSPSPRKRHPYYITSFEKVPGTPVGNALPDTLSDIQDVCNAALRSLVNNMGMASGPQVTVNEDRIAPGENPDQIFPWKRWRVTNDPMANAAVPPIGFFQPQSNAQELLGVYEKFTQIADEVSAIPRYITGSERMGGAGRTASGLAMLMGNASKILQTVAANIDRDIFSPLLQSLYDMVMLTDQSGMLRGDESIRVRGVAVAIQRETNRQRQIEFLTATANPIDTQIIGMRGRAAILRAVSSELGLDGETIVPPDEELEAAEKQQMAQQQAAMLGHNGGPPMEDPNAPGGQAPGGAVPPPKPSNQNLGVPEGNAMRGMT